MDLYACDVTSGNRQMEVVGGRVVRSCKANGPTTTGEEISCRYVCHCTVARRIRLVCMHSFRGTGPFAVQLFDGLEGTKVGVTVRVPACPCSDRCTNFPLIAHLKVRISGMFQGALTGRIGTVIAFSSCRYVFNRHAVRVSGKISFSSVPLGGAISGGASIVRLLKITRMRC